MVTPRPKNGGIKSNGINEKLAARAGIELHYEHNNIRTQIDQNASLW